MYVIEWKTLKSKKQIITKEMSYKRNYIGNWMIMTSLNVLF